MILQTIRAEYAQLITCLKAQKLRQSIEFDVARFESELLAVESLQEEISAPSTDRSDEAFLRESLSRLIPGVLLSFRGLVLQLQLDQVQVPEGLLGRISDLEKVVVSTGSAGRQAAEASLGL